MRINKLLLSARFCTLILTLQTTFAVNLHLIALERCAFHRLHLKTSSKEFISVTSLRSPQPLEIHRIHRSARLWCLEHCINVLLISSDNPMKCFRSVRVVRDILFSK